MKQWSQSHHSICLVQMKWHKTEHRFQVLTSHHKQATSQYSKWQQHGATVLNDHTYTTLILLTSWLLQICQWRALCVVQHWGADKRTAPFDGIFMTKYSKVTVWRLPAHITSTCPVRKTKVWIQRQSTGQEWTDLLEYHNKSPFSKVVNILALLCIKMTKQTDRLTHAIFH